MISLNYKVLPILVLCKNRTRYLDTCLRSISATVPSYVPVYVVNDGADNEDMIRYLTTSDEIELTDSPYPNQDDQWVSITGGLENYNRVKGVGDKVGVIRYLKSQYMRNFSHAVGMAFEKHKSSHVLRVEGDVVFKKSWYQNIVSMTFDPAVGIVSGCRHIFDNPKLVLASEGAEEVRVGTSGSQVYAISKLMCDSAPHLIDNDCKLREGADDFWLGGCRAAGFKFWIAKPGLAQHIGFKSEVYKGRKEFMISDHGVRAIDRHMHPPFEFAEIKEFDNKDFYCEND